jgi:hypothetical protein
MYALGFLRRRAWVPSVRVQGHGFADLLHTGGSP